MEDSPLLDLPLESFRSRSRLRAKKFFKDISLSVAPDYLGSWASRREFLKWYWYAFNFFNLFVDMSTSFEDASLATTLRGLDSILILVMIVSTRWLGYDTLWLDYTIVIVWAPFCILYRAAGSLDPQYFDYMEHTFSLIAACSGLHFSAHVAFIIFVLPPMMICGSVSLVVGYAFISIFFMVGSLINQVTSSTLYSQLQEKQRLVEENHHALEEKQREIVKAKGELEKLLDLATDGFCEIDVAQTCVTKTSAKLEHTLVGDRGYLQGMNLNEFISNDDQAHLQDLLGDTVNDSELRPLLVTCRTRTHEEFDAKLIPYSTSRTRLRVCLQALGERRSCKRESLEQVGLQNGHMDDGHDGIEHEEPDRDSRHDDTMLSDPGAFESVLSESAKSLVYSMTTVHEGKHRRYVMQGTQTEAPKLQEMQKESRSQGSQTDAYLMPSEPSPTSTPQRPPTLPTRCRSWVALGTRKRIYKRFHKTRMETFDALVLQLLERVNVCGRGCCKWHILLHTLSRFAWKKAQGDCVHDFKANSSWQCQGCTVLNDDTDEYCGVCWHYPREQRDQSDLSEDSSECADTEDLSEQEE